MKIAVFDIDGVLCDFEGFLVSLCGEGRGREFYKLSDRYSGETLRLATEIVKDPNYYYGLSPLSGFNLLDDVLERKFHVLFLTNRPNVGSMENFTKRWITREIKRIGYVVENLNNLLGVKFVDDKTKYLKTIKNGVEFFVDDNPEAVESANRAGIPAFTWAQPWNEHVYPKLFSTRDGIIMVQKSEWEDAEYFWQPLEAK